MKKKSKHFFLFLTAIVVCTIGVAQKASKDKNKETTFEIQLPSCEGIPNVKRVRVSVSTFKITASKAQGDLGSELATQLMSALVNTNCFRVLNSAKKLGDSFEENQLGQTGISNAPASNPKMLDAQILVEGEVTEYNLSKGSTSVLGVSVSGKEKATIGMIITMYDPKTREILASQSFNKQSNTGGSGGVRLLGIDMSKSSIKSPAVADACEKAIIDAVNFIAKKKDELGLPEANSGLAEDKKFNAQNCPVLKSAYIPKVMVILPEFHIQRRIPDPAGETEINRKFSEAGFRVVDPAMYATIKNGTKFDQASKDPKAAISLGKEFGADIVLYGEAFSDRTGTQQNSIVCRARTEVRAVRTDNAEIIATNGLEAGATDLSEMVAAKSALRSAAGLTVDYLLEQFCSKELVFSGKNASPVKTDASKVITDITIVNATYSKVKMLADLLGTKGSVLEKSVSNGTGLIRLEHNLKIDIADFIESKAGANFTIKDADKQKISVEAK